MWAERGKQFSGAASGSDVLLGEKDAFPAGLQFFAKLSSCPCQVCKPLYCFQGCPEPSSLSFLPLSTAKRLWQLSGGFQEYSRLKQTPSVFAFCPVISFSPGRSAEERTREAGRHLGWSSWAKGPCLWLRPLTSHCSG